MKEKKLSSIYLNIVGIILIFIGVIILNTGIATLETFTYLIGFVFIFLGITYFLREIISKFKNKNDSNFWLRAFVNIIIGLVIIIYPGIPITLVGIFTGIYCCLLSAIHLINTYTKFKDHLKGLILEFILSVFFIALGIFFLFSPYLHVNIIMDVVSIYFILFGMTYIKDGIKEIIPVTHKNKLKRKVRIMLPAIFSALIPRIVLEEVNAYLKPEENEEHDKPKYQKNKINVIPDIEVLVHVSKEGYGPMGHLDLIIDGKVISYGNYDGSSAKLFEAIGDGVLFIADAKKYIPFVIKDSHKTLFSFGLKLEDEQLKKIKEKLNSFKTNLTEWIPPEYNGKGKPLYPIRLSNDVPVKFYKFTKGKYKTYFVFSNNCVSIADDIIGSAGTDIINLNGIITPGVYYDYLNKEFAKKNSFVISKKIYN